MMIVRVRFIPSIFLVLISIWQLFFESPDNSEKVTHWFVIILKTALTIFLWVPFCQAKKDYKEPFETS